MKKLTLALVVGVMYLGTQATVVFAGPKVGQRDTCPECEKASNKGDAKDVIADTSSRKEKKGKGKGAKGDPLGITAHGGEATGKGQ